MVQSIIKIIQKKGMIETISLTMSKAEERALEAYPLKDVEHIYDEERVVEAREYFAQGYHQAEKDIKEELSKLFQEFTLDCIGDNKDIHILHFMDVFKNKLKEIGNE